MEFTPDGSLLGVPGGIYRTHKEALYCTFMFISDNISKPCFIINSMEPTFWISFNQNSIQNQTKNSLYQSNKNFLFMLMGASQASLYSTLSLEPLFLISNLHSLPQTCFRWFGQSSFGISSMDGFVSFGKFQG